MLAGYLPLISRSISFIGKGIALACTGLGLKRLWSTEAQSKYNFSTRLTFSTAYVLHMTSTGAATAALFNAGPLSATAATAFVALTSLFTAYVNFLESNHSYSHLHAELENCNRQLRASNLDVDRMVTLVEGIEAYEKQTQLFSEEISELKEVRQKLKIIQLMTTAEQSKELFTLYLSLQEHYQTNAHKNEILADFFTRRSCKPADIEKHLKRIFNELNKQRNELDVLQVELPRYPLPQTRERKKAKILELQQEIEEKEIVYDHCLQYHKMHRLYQEFIKKSQELGELSSGENLEIAEIQKIKNKKRYFDERITILERDLASFMDFTVTEYSPLVKIPVTEMLPDKINADTQLFLREWQTALGAYLQLLIKILIAQQNHVAKLKGYFEPLANESPEETQEQFDQLRFITHRIIDTNNALQLEENNKKSNKIKFDLSTVSACLALSLCLLPSDFRQAAEFLKPLMLGVGLVAGAGSLLSFYQKHLLMKSHLIKRAKSFKAIDGELKQKHQLVVNKVSLERSIDKYPSKVLSLEEISTLSFALLFDKAVAQSPILLQGRILTRQTRKLIQSPDLLPSFQAAKVMPSSPVRPSLMRAAKEKALHALKKK